ncbi:MAG: hypothetical protein U5N86_04425 [Planctomycetota bacterium]|nr:hypothetical protein [Planctomycetota bacterium]
MLSVPCRAVGNIKLFDLFSGKVLSQTENCSAFRHARFSPVTGDLLTLEIAFDGTACVCYYTVNDVIVKRREVKLRGSAFAVHSAYDCSLRPFLTMVGSDKDANALLEAYFYIDVGKLVASELPEHKRGLFFEQNVITDDLTAKFPNALFRKRRDDKGDTSVWKIALDRNEPEYEKLALATKQSLEGKHIASVSVVGSSDVPFMPSDLLVVFSDMTASIADLKSSLGPNEDLSYLMPEPWSMCAKNVFFSTRSEPLWFPPPHMHKAFLADIKDKRLRVRLVQCEYPILNLFPHPEDPNRGWYGWAREGEFTRCEFVKMNKAE